MHEILYEAQTNGKCKYYVKWRDTIVLRENLAISKKDGYKTERHRPFPHDEYIGLTNRKHWETASWKPTYEPAESIDNSEQIQQLLAEMGARLNESQQELGSTGRDADLKDDKQTSSIIRLLCMQTFFRILSLGISSP